MVVCLDQGADLHMAKLLPVATATVSGTGSPGYTRKRAVKRVCVCVRACVLVNKCY